MFGSHTDREREREKEETYTEGQKLQQERRKERRFVRL